MFVVSQGAHGLSLSHPVSAIVVYVVQTDQSSACPVGVRPALLKFTLMSSLELKSKNCKLCVR